MCFCQPKSARVNESLHRHRPVSSLTDACTRYSYTNALSTHRKHASPSTHRPNSLLPSGFGSRLSSSTLNSALLMRPCVPTHDLTCKAHRPHDPGVTRDNIALQYVPRRTPMHSHAMITITSNQKYAPDANYNNTTTTTITTTTTTQTTTTITTTTDNTTSITKCTGSSAFTKRSQSAWWQEHTTLHPLAVYSELELRDGPQEGWNSTPRTWHV